MKANRFLAGAGLASALVLAGCQTDTSGTAGTAYPSTPVAQTTASTPPMLMPAASPVGRTRTSTSTKSWTSADGTQHTRTTSTSAGVSVDPNAAGALVAGLLGGTSTGTGAGGVAVAQSASYAGKWNVSAAGRNCSMTLRAPVAGGSAMASTFGCFGSDLMRVSSWSLRGYEVVLTGFGQQVASMRVTQPNRMDGKLAEGGAISAWR